MTTERIPMAVTMGDPSGVGPEIVLRHFAAGGLGDDVVVYGDAAILAHGAELLGLDVDIDVVARDALAARRPGALAVVDAGLLAAADHAPGVLDGRAGAAARDYVVQATQDALAGRIGRARDDADEQGGDAAHRRRRSSATPS